MVKPLRAKRPGTKKGTQLELVGIADCPLRPVGASRRGGRRAGAGRKRAPGARPSVPHRARAVHVGRHPVHVTLRARSGLPSFRHQSVASLFREVLEAQSKRRYTKIFRVVEFSIQENHLHLIVEATGVVETGGVDAPEALRAGVSGLMIAFAKRLNGLLRRKGKVWGDRWHGRELPTPSEVRHALVYVFRNIARHGARLHGDGAVDQLSSAPRFRGFSRPVVEVFAPDRPRPKPWPVNEPRTWLLEKGWRLARGGLIDPNEVRRTGP